MGITHTFIHSYIHTFIHLYIHTFMMVSIMLCLIQIIIVSSSNVNGNMNGNGNGNGNQWKEGFCYRNISICEKHYNDKLIKPLQIGYISLERLKDSIRYYNYEINYIRQMSNNNKRGRREVRRKFNNGYFYNSLSYSDELDYIDSVCDINYNKLDTKTLKIIGNKYKRALEYHNIKMRRSSYFYNMGVILICILMVMLFIC